MVELTESSLLQIWETGAHLHAIDQALLVLSVAFPEETADKLASLAVGQRDARLLSVYESTFGPHVSGVADCPECQEAIEIAFRVDDIRLPSASQETSHVFRLDTAGYSIQFHLPGSRHLAGARGLWTGTLPLWQPGLGAAADRERPARDRASGRGADPPVGWGKPVHHEHGHGRGIRRRLRRLRWAHG